MRRLTLTDHRQVSVDKGVTCLRPLAGATEVNSRTQALLTLPFRNRGCGRDTAARPCELRFCDSGDAWVS